MKIKDINLTFQDMDFGAQGHKDVREIMEAIKRGEEIPPILVSPSGYLQDGRHRLTAFKNLGYKTIEVVYGHHPAAKVVKKPSSKRAAKFKQERDEVALQLLEATTASRYNVSRVFHGKKYYLLTHTSGKDAMDAVEKAKKKSNFIEENFPYAVFVLKDGSGRGFAEIWVRKK